jgi:general secretion pathway protein K
MPFKHSSPFDLTAGLLFAKDKKGSALVVVLATVALIVALLSEFIYSVYTSTISFDYWQKSQGLSLAARSGLVLASRAITQVGGIYNLSPNDSIFIPVPKVTDAYRGSLTLRAYDENARFNLNSLVFQNGQVNPAGYESFKRLLRTLKIDEEVADLIVDWLDRDNDPRMSGSEEGAKNAYFDALDEIYQIKGLKVQDIEALWDYVTVYGYDRIDSPLVNINSASVPVIMSIDNRISREMADRILNYRSLEPFKDPADITKVSGFEGPIGQSMIGKIAVRVRRLRVFSEAEVDRVKRTIECVVELQDNNAIVRYWSER